MDKQTVNQLYEEQQQNKQFKSSDSEKLQAQPENYRLELINQATQSIQQSQQSIRQIQAGQYDQFQLANQRLQKTLQKLQQFQMIHSKTPPGLPESTKQQLEQAYHELNQAGQTIQLVQQTMNNN